LRQSSIWASPFDEQPVGCSYAVLVSQLQEFQESRKDTKDHEGPQSEESEGLRTGRQAIEIALVLPKIFSGLCVFGPLRQSFFYPRGLCFHQRTVSQRKSPD
jgi:hypothetical protein